MANQKTATHGATGMGSIRQISLEKNGKTYTYWQGRISVGFDLGTGKQIQRSFSCKTQKEAREKLREITHELDIGSYMEPCKLSLGEWLDTWTQEYLGGVKPRSVEIYKRYCRLYIKPKLAAVKLDELDTGMIQNMYNELMKEKNLAPKTIKCLHGVLHKALKQAMANGLIRANPSDACVLPRCEKVEMHPLDEQDITAFLKQIKGDPYENLMIVTLFTGMREGEILGLKWDCVDFRRGLITIKRQLQRFEPTKPGEAYECRLCETKNSRDRVLTPAMSVMTALARQRTLQNEMKEKAGSAWQDNGFVFTNALGGHEATWNIYRHYKNAVSAIGRPDARFHDMRHSYAVAAIQSGDDIKTVQSNLGHATAAFTLDVYGHVTDQMKRESANRMEMFFQSVSV